MLPVPDQHSSLPWPWWLRQYGPSAPCGDIGQRRSAAKVSSQNASITASLRLTGTGAAGQP